MGGRGRNGGRARVIGSRTEHIHCFIDIVILQYFWMISFEKSSSHLKESYERKNFKATAYIFI